MEVQQKENFGSGRSRKTAVSSDNCLICEVILKPAMTTAALLMNVSLKAI